MTTPRLGAACDRTDLGRRAGFVDTAEVIPTVTHFKAYRVTEGTTGFQNIALTNTEVITVTVGGNASITATFGNATLGTVAANVGFSVSQTATTNTQVRTVQWNLNAPGYYGVYSGTYKVRGTYYTLNCNRVGSALQWIKRPGGEYTMWGRDEEGVVRCEDDLLDDSLGRAAQIELGCDGEAARQAATASHKAENARVVTGASTVDAPTTMAVPTGYTCDAGRYRIVSYNGLVMDVDTDQVNAFNAPVTWSTLVAAVAGVPRCEYQRRSTERFRERRVRRVHATAERVSRRSRASGSTTTPARRRRPSRSSRSTVASRARRPSGSRPRRRAQFSVPPRPRWTCRCGSTKPACPTATGPSS